MSYYFNADFETCILEERPFNPQLKMNREFEYFIMLLEKEALYTPLDYSEDYLKFIRDNLNPKAHYTNAKDNLVPWCADESVDKVIVSKETSARLNQDQLGLDQIKIIAGKSELKDNYLYKRFHGFSGMGHLLAPRDKSKIEVLLLNGERLIEEPLYERVYDFSTLVMEVRGTEKRVRYQNFVDKSFHYKGTLMREFKLADNLEEQYQREIDLIIEHYQKLGVKTPFSIDSFIYKENKELKLKTLSEVNARKSMGYVCYQLAQKFQAKNYALILNRHDQSFQSGMKTFKLSPEGKMFKSYFCLVEDKKYLSSFGFRLL